MQVQFKMLKGHDLHPPVRSTLGAAAFNLPAVLSRPFLSVDKKPHFCWQFKRYDGVKMPPTPAEKPIELATIVDCLRAHAPTEAEKLKGRKTFPHNYLSLKVQPGETLLIPLGIQTRFPSNYVALLFSRASSALKRYRLGNCVGVIDSDYPGEWYAAIRNDGHEPFPIQHGQELVQVLFVELPEIEWQDISDQEFSAETQTDRTGGFGSTDAVPEEPIADAVVADEVVEETPVVVETPEVREKEAVYLSIRGMRLGPIAHFDAPVHYPLMSEGPGPVVGLMLEEAKVSLPVVFDRLLVELAKQDGKDVKGRT